jgi:steroid 5-alpha reductase family enzyme
VILLLLIVTPSLMLVFAAVWALCVRIKNYGYLDVIWSLSVANLAPIYAIAGGGDPQRRLAFGLVGALWSLRLGIYILVRVTRSHPVEDARYKTLRREWPGAFRFLVFFELQALIAIVFSLPFILASFNATAEIRPIEWIGLGIALISTAGEALADWQAQTFKRKPGNKSAIVDVGLWHYSRHPNYFFESMVWWGFFIAALGTRWGWITVVCPLMMLYLLLNVTGIPLSEKHSLESRGEAYRRYQRTTSRFVPWFRTGH